MADGIARKKAGRQRPASPTGFGSTLLRLHRLEVDVLLGMHLTGYRIQRIHRLRDQIAGVAPRRVYAAIRRGDALILAERIANGDLAVVVGGCKIRSVS